jgi:glycosyltransferase involved in cell wall biosynthesis
MGVSVVIVSKRGEKEVNDCISSIKRQSVKANEIIVVSEEPVLVKGVKNIVTKAKRSEARNIGWKRAKNNIIMFAEADSIFDKDWIKYISEEFNKGADAVIDRRAVYSPETYVQNCGNEYFTLRYSHYKPFCGQAFKKNVLRAVNGFDEKLEYAEDHDLGNRILKKRLKIRLAGKAYQFHKGEPKTFNEVIKRSFVFGKEKANGYFRKYAKEAPIIDSLLILLWLMLIPLALINLWSLVVFFAIDLILYGLFLAKLIIIERGYKIKTKYVLGIAMMNYYKWMFTNLGFMYGKIRGKK